MAFGGESYFDPQITMLSAVLVAFLAMCGRRLRKILESILARLFTTYFASGSAKVKNTLSWVVFFADARCPTGAKTALDQLCGNGFFEGMPKVPPLQALAKALQLQEKAPGRNGGAGGTEVELVPAGASPLVSAGASPSKAAGDLEEGRSAAATISKAEATDKIEAKAFVSWLDGVGDEKTALIGEAIGEALLAAVHEDSARVERSTKEVFFVLQVLLGLFTLVNYFFFAAWPEGSFYFAQLPYVVRVAAFKPFTVPLYYLLTVLAQYTFAEVVFGHSAAHRDGAAGACVYSPLPRSRLSLLFTYVVFTLFGLWLVAAFASVAALAVVFSPALLLPIFVLPMLVMYVPAAFLDTLVQYQSRAKAHLPTRLNLQETVLVLKCTTTLLIGGLLLLVPLLPFYEGGLSWGDGASEIAGALLLSFDFPALRLAVQWPDFTWDFQLSLALSLGLIAVELFVWVIRALSAAVDYYWPVLSPPGAAEVLVSSVFAKFTWQPVRAAMDTVRTAVAVSIWARRDFVELVFNDFPQDYLGERAGRLLKNLVRKGVASVCLAFTFGPVLVAFGLPRTKVFSAEATEDEVLAFFADEASLAYTGFVCRNNENLTGRTWSAISNCVWLRSIDLVGCSGIGGSTADLKGLVNLTFLCIGGCSSIGGSAADLKGLVNLTVLILGSCSDFKGSTADLKGLVNLTHLDIDGCTGIVGSAADLKGLVNLTFLCIGGCSSIGGSAADLKSLVNLTELNISGCSGIGGSTADIKGLVNLTVLYIGCCGASVNGADEDGTTALMWAASGGRVQVTKHLLRVGADQKAKDKDGKTALDLAKQNGHDAVAALFGSDI